ncbi:MAG TPA: hypothetical protein VF473_07280, partial [Cyclobacteriaceae bacterium]
MFTGFSTAADKKCALHLVVTHNNPIAFRFTLNVNQNLGKFIVEVRGPSFSNIATRISAAFALIAAPGVAFPQTFASFCAERERESLQLIPGYYQSGNYNRIDSLLYRLDRCSTIPLNHSWRMRTLLRLKDHRLESTDFHESDLVQLERYVNSEQLVMLLDSVDENPQAHLRTYFGPNFALYRSFNQFTKEIAKEILPAYQFKDDCSTEKMLLNVLSGDLKTFTKKLADNSCTALPAKVYRNSLKTVSRRPVVDIYLYTGMWLPNGNASLLGNHPIIGFGSG